MLLKSFIDLSLQSSKKEGIISLAIAAEDNKRQAQILIACGDRVDNKYSSKHPNMILMLLFTIPIIISLINI